MSAGALAASGKPNAKPTIRYRPSENPNAIDNARLVRMSRACGFASTPASEDDADLFEAIKSGAQGYIFKSLDSDEFFRLLEGVARGEPALTSGLARKLLGEFARPPAPAQSAADGPQALTEREREVLDLLVQGVTT